MKTKLYLLLIIALGSTCAAAFAQAPFKGLIQGQVIDKASGKPVEFANVALKRSGDSTAIKGVVSDLNGNFVMEVNRAGVYDLTIYYIGYQRRSLTKISLGPGNAVVNIGKFELNEDTKQLSEVVVEDKREYIQTTAEGVVITPDKNPTQIGGTATDVMRDAPGVRVDESGNVTLRGGRPNILINGRNSGMAGGGGRWGGGGMGGGGLDQISSDEIASIEINTNPSARFDADGVGGLINIRLKRDRQLGTHGTFNGGIGNRGRFNGGFRLNHRTEKWNFFLSYNGRHDRRLAEDRTDRSTRYSSLLNPNVADSTDILTQGRNSEILTDMHNLRAGIDYYFSDKESLSFEASFGYRENTNVGDLNSLTTRNDNFLRQTRQQTSNSGFGNNYDLSLTYKKEFAKKGKEFNASFSTSLGDNLNLNNLLNQQMMADGSVNNNLSLSQRSRNDNLNGIYTLQLDYALPLGGKDGLFETGYKGIVRTLTTDAGWDRFNNTTQAWERNNFLSNKFSYDENVQAVYAAYKNKFKKWDYSVGVRLEKVWYGGNVEATNQNLDFRREYFNIFPTARIAYNISKDGEFIKLSYSRRIDRPGLNDLNPFRDISNPLNWREGNPNLTPELIDVIEIGYNKYWDKFSITPNVFYRYRSNLVQNVVELVGNDITLSRPINIGSSQAYGVELTAAWEIAKWWNLNGTYSYFQTDINAGNNENATINSSVNSWNTRLSSAFTIAKTWRLQANYFYNSPTAVAQGQQIGFYAFGFGVQKSVMKNKGSIGFNIRDAFYNMRFGSNTFGQNQLTLNQVSKFAAFDQSSTILRDTRTIFLTFRYRF